LGEYPRSLVSINGNAVNIPPSIVGIATLLGKAAVLLNVGVEVGARGEFFQRLGWS
jgi:hypothetical protein